MQITNNITWEEAVHTDTGLPNKPSALEKKNIVAVCKTLFQPIRDKWGKPINVGSLYRSEAVNKKIGGSKTSAHRFGLAVDISCANKKENGKLWDAILRMWKEGIIHFDQLIWEFGDNKNPQWIHCGLAKATLTDKPRGQILRAIKKNGVTVYEPF